LAKLDEIFAGLLNLEERENLKLFKEKKQGKSASKHHLWFYE